VFAGLNTTVSHKGKDGVMFEVRANKGSKSPRSSRSSDDTLLLLAPTQADADAWVAAINENIHLLNAAGASGAPLADFSLAVPSGAGSRRSKSPSLFQRLGDIVGFGGKKDDDDDDDDAADPAIAEADAEVRRRKYEARQYIDTFDLESFEQNMSTAMDTVRRVLDTQKRPLTIDKAAHTYDSKFELAERATHAAIQALLQPLEDVGLDRKTLQHFRETVQKKKRPVEIVFQALEKCKFLRRTERKEEDPTRYVAEYTSSVGRALSAIKDTITFKTVTTIVEYHWRFDYEYRLVMRSGKDEHTLMRGARHCELITSDESSPRPEVTVRDDRSLDFTWLLQQVRSGKKVKKRSARSKSPSKSPRGSVDSGSKSPRRSTTPTPDDNDAGDAAGDDDDNDNGDDDGANAGERAPTRFAIERSVKSCRTPRRNCDVEDALSFFYGVHTFACGVTDYLAGVFAVHDDNVDDSTFDVEALFAPVLVLMEQRERVAQFLAASDNAALANEQRRSLDAKLAAIKKAVGHASGLVGADEARVVCMLQHAASIAELYSNTLDHVEALLEKQLLAAVGKVLRPLDFDAYMQFHCRKLFAPSRAPTPFVYGVRRDAAGCVEGVLSIDVDLGDGSLPQPLHTLTAAYRNVRDWSFALDGATRAAIAGDLYVHAGMLHSFAPEPSASALHLHARARQFSSFILLCGSIIGKGELLPTHALYIANKSELDVVLETTALPSAKAFKAAVESMSPEQQRFAKAFRAMQLESTLFGVAVVQVKPQLELLLNLVPRTLDKEIELTQKLLDLMVTYQIPSDMLAYNAELGEVEMPPPLPPAPTLKCNGGHTLAPSTRATEGYTSGWRCDLCRFHGQPGTVRHHCYACKFDVCATCIAPYLVVPTDATKAKAEAEADRVALATGTPDDKLVADKRTRVRQVRAHVAKIELVIKQLKGNELEAAIQARDFVRPLKPFKPLQPLKPLSFDDVPDKKPKKEKRSFMQKLKALLPKPIPTTSDYRKSSRKDKRHQMMDEDRYSSNAAEISVSADMDLDCIAASSVDMRMAARDVDMPISVNEDAGGQAGGEADGEGGSDDAKPDEKKEFGAPEADGNDAFDVTQVPSRLDSKLEQLDDEGAVAPTTIKLADSWTKKSFASLMSEERLETLEKDDLRTEKQRAFDMLDALSRSGDLPLQFCELHVVILSTHMFAQSVVHTIVRGNVNPIEHVEKSQAIVASVLFSEPPEALIRNAEVPRVRAHAANLFNNGK
jgi:hypothetical protein